MSDESVTPAAVRKPLGTFNGTSCYEGDHHVPSGQQACACLLLPAAAAQPPLDLEAIKRWRQAVTKLRALAQGTIPVDTLISDLELRFERLLPQTRALDEFDAIDALLAEVERLRSLHAAQLNDWLVKLFGAMHELDDFARFIEIRRVTALALDNDQTCVEDLRSMLGTWLRLIPAPPRRAHEGDVTWGMRTT